MEYSSAVRQRFEHSHAQIAASEPESTFAASAADRSLNVWIRFAVSVRRDTVTDVEFSVFGCPHLIAACDWTAEWLRGRPVAALRELPLEAISAELDVPREKFGKLLRLEDALIACAGRHEQDANGGE